MIAFCASKNSPPSRNSSSSLEISSSLNDSSPLKVTVLTLFPEIFPGPLGISLLGEGLKRGLWTLDVVNIRDFALDKHQRVDAPCFGGGPGMVMRADVIDRALKSVVKQEESPELIYLSPRGGALHQSLCHRWAQNRQPLVLLCGRYEAVDQRVLDFWEFEEVSLGDFVLAGGEIAAMALIEGCVRLIKGILGDEASIKEESFSRGLLEYPHYTRPRVWQGLEVPDVLFSGHHKRIEEWRQLQAEKITQKRRPDLWTRYKQHAIREGSEEEL